MPDTATATAQVQPTADADAKKDTAAAASETKDEGANGTVLAAPVDAAKPETKEGKAEGEGQKPETADGAKPEAKGAPERYDLKLPKDSPLDPKAVEEIAAFARERGFSNEQAQAVLERLSADRAAYVEGQKAKLEAEQVEWVEQIKSHKEYGGDNFVKAAETAKRAFHKFAPKEFVAWAEKTGMGNNPWLFDTFYRIGKAMSEDTLVKGSAPGGAPKKRLADLLYGNTPQPGVAVSEE